MFLLRIKDRVECCKGTGLHGGDTAQKKPILGVGWGGHRTYFLDWVNNWGVEGGGGDTAHTLLKRGTIGVGTPHNIERKSKSLN